MKENLARLGGKPKLKALSLLKGPEEEQMGLPSRWVCPISPLVSQDLISGHLSLERKFARLCPGGLSAEPPAWG